MVSGRTSGYTYALLFVGIIILFMGIWAGTAASLDEDQTDVRSDVIPLDALTPFGELEYPMVYFIHDKHTRALSEQGRGCEVCHPNYTSEITGEELRSSKFQRVQDPNQKAAFQDLYHEGCIDCHKETAARGLESGPAECRDCHTPEPRARSNRQPFGMNLSLHYRHSEAAEKKCQVCHHQYNETEKKLVYEEGREGTCRYCHLSDSTAFLAQTEPEQVAELDMTGASHLSCITCHLDKKAENGPDQDFGPVECSGCHSPEAQAAIEPVVDRPRMKRDQPEAALIEAQAPEVEGRMAAVPFNHRFHEQNLDTCRVCHHASLTNCTECHTLTGSEKGLGVRLEAAMHQSQSEQSCLGCHDERKAAAECAGCHAFIAVRPLGDSGCRDCHLRLDDEEQLPEDEAARAEMAARMLENRPTLSGAYRSEDVPETVEIGVLADEYQPAKMPHRKIVDAMVAKMKESQLGEYFHTGEGGLCQGCHHNSPASKKPPRCASCHGQPFDPRDAERPGLKGAYHIQCIGCHEAMELEKPAATACAECHEAKTD